MITKHAIVSAAASEMSTMNTVASAATLLVAMRLSNELVETTAGEETSLGAEGEFIDGGDGVALQYADTAKPGSIGPAAAAVSLTPTSSS